MGARGQCGGCRARVIWVQLESGRRMPVEQHPDAEGTVAVMRDVHGTHVGRVLKADERPHQYEHLHVTHFANCPAYKAEQARKAAAKRQAAAVAAAPNVTSLADYSGRRSGRRR